MKTTAPELARRLLHKTDRWSHTHAVGNLGYRWMVTNRIAPVVAQAAWLIDIGYSPDVTKTGHPPADAARMLARMKFSPFVVSLVAHHNGAILEGKAIEPPSDFRPPPRDLADALIALDLHIGLDGEPTDPRLRIAQVLRGYPSYHPAHRALDGAKADLLAACERVPSGD